MSSSSPWESRSRSVDIELESRLVDFGIKVAIKQSK